MHKKNFIHFLSRDARGKTRFYLSLDLVFSLGFVRKSRFRLLFLLSRHVKLKNFFSDIEFVYYKKQNKFSKFVLFFPVFLVLQLKKLFYPIYPWVFRSDLIIYRDFLPWQRLLCGCSVSASVEIETEIEKNLDSRTSLFFRPQ